MIEVGDLFSKALELPATQRAELAHQLLLTLEPDDDNDLADEAWVDEMAARLKVVKQGNYQAYDWEETIRRMRQSLADR
jgi:hypothetical protein